MESSVTLQTTDTEATSLTIKNTTIIVVFADVIKAETTSINGII